MSASVSINAPLEVFTITTPGFIPAMADKEYDEYFG